MMFKALLLVHFWGILLLKEQMMTSVRKTLKLPVWSGQNQSISSKNNHKTAVFLPVAFRPSLPQKWRGIPAKSGDFCAFLSLKVPWNLTFFPQPIRSPDYGNSSLLPIQGAKEVIFKACHSGKLKLAYTSPNIISTSPMNILMSRIDFTVLL